MLQRGDIQTQRGYALCHRFGILTHPIQCAGRKHRDALAQQLVKRRRLVKLQDSQRALHLRKQRRQVCELGGFLRIAEECVQCTFNGRQIDLHFLTYLEHQHAFLRALGHVVHQRIGATLNRRQRRAGHRCLQARNNIVGLQRKFGGEAKVILQRGFEEQESSGHLKGLYFGGCALHLAKMRAYRTERLYQVGDVLVGLLLRGLEQGLGLRDVSLQRGTISTGKLKPILFLCLHLIAERAHHTLQLFIAARFARRFRQGEQRIKPVEFANLAQSFGLSFGSADYQQDVTE